MIAPPFSGPLSGVPGCLVGVADGVWLTSGRAAVLEGSDHLAVIDPGDEACGTPPAPAGPLADLLELVRQTGKPLRWLLVTHAHPDHIANLALFRSVGSPRVAAHAASPVRPDLAIDRETQLDLGGGVLAVPTPGHSSGGDDLTFWLPRARVVFPGDLVQPKGEVWERTFYPSPWVFFTDGDRYLESLARLSALPFETLVTGHREVRRGQAASQWVELTARSIRRVAEAVAAWKGPEDLAAAGPAIYRQIAGERGLPEEIVERRLRAPAGSRSAFESYDLPGIEHFWRRLRRS